MKDYDILTKIDEFNKFIQLATDCYFDEGSYYTTKDSKYSQWNTDDGGGKTIEASKIEKESKLNLDWVLKIMESKYEWTRTRIN